MLNKLILKYWSENFRMVDIKISAWSSLFDSLQGTLKEKWKEVKDETRESQALNDTYETSIWCFCLEKII